MIDYDQAFDNIVTRLKNYSTAQALIDSALQFHVEEDWTRSVPASGPSVFVGVMMGSINPRRERTGVFVAHGYDVQFIMDLIVRSPGKRTTQGTTSIVERGDQLAGARLRLLLNQVYNALYATEFYDLGLTPGTVATRPLFRYDAFIPEDLIIERPLIAGTVTMDVGLQLDPTRTEGVPLEELFVQAQKYSALYSYGE